MQIDLGADIQVAGVRSQGDGLHANWTTAYDVRIRQHGTEEWTAREGLVGNTDQNTIRTHLFGEPINGRYVRFVPKSTGKNWGGNWAGLRVEVLVMPATTLSLTEFYEIASPVELALSVRAVLKINTPNGVFESTVSHS